MAIRMESKKRLPIYSGRRFLRPLYIIVGKTQDVAPEGENICSREGFTVPVKNKGFHSFYFLRR